MRDFDEAFSARRMIPADDSNPYYVTTLSDAYVQTRLGQYYKGCSQPMKGRCKDKLYCVLYNPINSGRNLYINKVIHSNLSSTPCSIKSYLGRAYTERLYENRTIENANPDMRYLQPCGRLFYGECFKPKNLHPNFYTIVPGMTSNRGTPSGSIIVIPGESYIAEFEGFGGASPFKVVSTLCWWEEPRY